MTAQELFEKALQNFESNVVVAVDYLTQAANLDYVPALDLVADMHENGYFPTGSDPKEALRLYEKLATEHNSVGAKAKLGMLYCSGKCNSGPIGTRNFEKGRKFIEEVYDKWVRSDAELNPFEQKSCIDIGYFVGQGESREDGWSGIYELEQSIGLLTKGLENKSNLGQFYTSEAAIQVLESYLTNRKELLDNEKQLQTDVTKLKETLKL